MEIYRSKDLQEKIGASKIQVSHWVNMGCIKPYREDRRRGGSHEFDRQNLIEAGICKELSDLHIPVADMVEGLNLLRFMISKNLWKNDKFLEELYLIYSSPLKWNYGKFPEIRRSIKRANADAPKKAFMPNAIKKKDLLETIEFLQAGVILALGRVLDLIR